MLLQHINRVYRDELTSRLQRLTVITSSSALFVAVAAVAVIAISVVFTVLNVGMSLQL